jgi:hypothetical protein
MHNLSSIRRYIWQPKIADDHGVLFASVGVQFAKLFLTAKLVSVSFRQRMRSTIGRLALVFVLVCFSSAASAMYKCVDANGTNSFQDSPCKVVVHDNSANPVIGNRGPMPIEEPKHNDATPGQPTQMPVQMPDQASVQETGAPNPGQNMNTDQPDTGGPVSKEDMGSAAASQIFVAFAPLLIYMGIAALQGWWASARNRSFWSWFFLSLIFTPGLIFLIFLFRGQDPERPSWAR